MTDRRSNRCARCGCSYTSRKHQRQCKGMTRQAINHANHLRNLRRRCESAGYHRTPSQIFASMVNTDLSSREELIDGGSQQ